MPVSVSREDLFAGQIRVAAHRRAGRGGLATARRERKRLGRPEKRVPKAHSGARTGPVDSRGGQEARRLPVDRSLMAERDGEVVSVGIDEGAVGRALQEA